MEIVIREVKKEDKEAINDLFEKLLSNHGCNYGIGHGYPYDCAIKENNYQSCNHNIYNSTLIENKYTKFDFDRKIVRKDYITANNQNRTGYTIKEKIKYDVICKVEL